MGAREVFSPEAARKKRGASVEAPEDDGVVSDTLFSLSNGNGDTSVGSLCVVLWVVGGVAETNS